MKPQVSLFCVSLGQRGVQGGTANFVDGGFVSDDTHTRLINVFGREGDILLGRFAVTLRSASETVQLSDGAFRATKR